MGSTSGLLRRRPVQLTLTAVVAFTFGAGLGGTSPTEAAPEAGQSDVTRSALADAEAEAEALSEKLERAEVEAQRAVEAVRAEAEQTVKQVRTEAVATQRAAVEAAKATVRRRAAARQETAVAAAVADATRSATADEAQPEESGPTDPQFSYCYEANDAGYGNYVAGVDPEYDWYDDRDGDGSVCEF